MKVIAISGTHSTGKSTLFDKLQSLYNNGVFIPEVVRSVTPEELLTPYGQEKVFITKKTKFMSVISENPELVIMDRGFIDNVAYFIHNSYIGQWDREDISTIRYIIDSAIELDRKYIAGYIFMPFERMELIDDGFRFNDEHGRYMVDLIIYSLIESINKPYIIYDSDDINRVVEFINKYL